MTELKRSELSLETVSSGVGGKGVSWELQRGKFEEGLSAGVEVVVVGQGDFSFSLLPTRGMGIWQAHLGDWRIGWDSPVKAPVHPAFVNAKSRNGLGWLEGFNELLCRCGLSFNGPPGKDEGARSGVESDVTLHGQIANIPAHSLRWITGEHGEIGLYGIVDEAALFGPQLRLETSIVTTLGQQNIIIRDKVTNLGSQPAELQLLYHTNIGSPLLEEGAHLLVPATKVVPRTPWAAEDVDHYSEYLAPTPGYAEQVYFFEPLANRHKQSVALLQSRAADRGVSLRFNIEQLPCFSQWKCTQAQQDGYVTGLEPATNYPNFKAYERTQGRVPLIEPGASFETELVLTVHSTADDVAKVVQEIHELQRQSPFEYVSEPVEPFCAPD